MKIQVVDLDNKEIDLINIKEEKLSNESDLVYHFNKYVRNKNRTGFASCKTRSEVKLTKAKAYKQKGTGRARRGANSSPLIRGGGVIFGPKPRSYKFKLNKKIIKRAISEILTRSLNKIIVLDVSEIKEKKTKIAASFLSKFKDKKKFMLLISHEDQDLYKIFSNCANVTVDFITDFIPQNYLSTDQLILTKSAFNVLSGENND